MGTATIFGSKSRHKHGIKLNKVSKLKVNKVTNSDVETGALSPDLGKYAFVDYLFY